jgi:hypothetical protein
VGNLSTWSSLLVIANLKAVSQTLISETVRAGELALFGIDPSWGEASIIQSFSFVSETIDPNSTFQIF